MRRVVRGALVAVALALGLVPIAFFATILLLPLWSWVERTQGIEAVGHSGPADWCFTATYAVLLALALLAWRLDRRRSG